MAVSVIIFKPHAGLTDDCDSTDSISGHHGGRKPGKISSVFVDI
jgi:hypothetical protein